MKLVKSNEEQTNCIKIQWKDKLTQYNNKVYLVVHILSKVYQDNNNNNNNNHNPSTGWQTQQMAGMTLNTSTVKC